jgi:endonuclease/exonuclease/phosphatase family metal-dependent hydrolase
VSRRLALVSLVLALAAPAAVRAGSLRIVTFNLLHGGVELFGCGDCQRLEERLAMTIEELRGLDPDLIGLQEASAGPGRGDVAGRVAEALGFSYARAESGYPLFRPQIAFFTGFVEGPAILSRFPIVSSETFMLEACDLWYRRAVVCAVVTPPGGEVDVCSVHTEENACHLRSLARQLRERRSTRPLVLVGDLNAPPSAPGMDTLVSELGFVDAFHAAHPDAAGFTVWQPPRITERRAGRRVDYVMLAPPHGVRILESRVVLDAPQTAADGRPLWPSDHYGVLAEVGF